VSRPTPFDLALRPLVEELNGLREAAARAGRDLRRRDEFLRWPEAQRLVERMRGPGDAERADLTGGYLALLYAGYRFWDAGSRVLAPPRESLERALAAPAPSAPPAIPGGACYLQLPANWFWARAAEQGPHEPLDGCFVAADPRGDELTILAALGLRVERAGFTQVTLQVSPDDFALAAGERRSPPFAPLMDGGAAAGFRSVATAAELLVLVSLALPVSGR
jgi:hypothetical protein